MEDNNKLFEHCFNSFRTYEHSHEEQQSNPFIDPITYIDNDGEPQRIPETVQQEAIILYNNTRNRIINKPKLFTFTNGVIFLLVCLFLLYMYFK